MLGRRALGPAPLGLARGGRMVATHSRPFPLLRDTLDPTCPQLEAGKRRAEEQIAKLHQLNKICLAGGAVILVMCAVVVQYVCSELCAGECGCDMNVVY